MVKGPSWPLGKKFGSYSWNKWDNQSSSEKGAIETRYENNRSEEGYQRIRGTIDPPKYRGKNAR